MKNFLVKSAHYFWLTIAILLVLVAVLVQLARELSPLLNDNKYALAEQLEAILDSQVDIGFLDANWRGLSPSIQLKEFAIYPSDTVSAQQPASLYVHEGYVEIDFLRSALERRLVIAKLTLNDARARLFQDQDGNWGLVGIRNTAQSGSTIDDPMDVFLLADQVQINDAQMQLRNYYGNEMELSVTSVLFENSDEFHRVSAEAKIEEKPVARFTMEATGDPRRREGRDLKGYLVVRELPVKQIQDLLLSSGWNIRGDELQGSRLDVQLWFSSQERKVYDLVGNLNLSLVEANIKDRVRLPSELSGLFAGTFGIGPELHKTQITINQLALGWPDAALQPMNARITRAESEWQFSLDRLDLDELTRAIQATGFRQPLLNDAVDTLAAKGNLRNISLSLPDGVASGAQVTANLDQVSVSGWRGAPGIIGVNGFVSLDKTGGYVLLDTDAIELNFEDVFPEPMRLQNAVGSVGWKLAPEENTINVYSGPLSVDAEQGRAQGQFHLYIPWIQDSVPMEMSLAVGAANMRADQRTPFVPEVLDDNLKQWLASSILGGTASEGKFIYRGRFSGPFVGASVQLALDVVDGSVKYQPEWPQVDRVNGRVLVNNADVSARVTHGVIWNTDISDTHLAITTKNDDLWLDLNGRMQGQASDGLRFLTETPLREEIGEAFDTWHADGLVSGSLALSMPLDEEKLALGRQHVQLQIEPSRVTVDDLELTLEQVSGPLVYDSELGVTSDGLRGILWGEPVSAEISSPLVVPETGARDIVVAFEGLVQAARLQDWLKSAEMSFVSGATSVSGTLTIPAQNSEQQDQPEVIFAAQTNLEGIAIDLPAPYGKSVTQKLGLDVRVPVYERATKAFLTVENGINAEINIDGEYVSGVGVGLGRAPFMAEGEIWLTGKVPDFDFMAWLDVIERYEQYSSGYPLNPSAPQLLAFIDVQVEKANIEDLVAEQITAKGRQEPGIWVFDLDSEFIRGQVIVPEAEGLPIEAAIAHLQLPEPDPDTPVEEDPLAETDLSGLPMANVAVQEFFIGEEDFGSWEFELRPIEGGVQANNLRGFIRGVAIEGSDGGTATARWLQGDDGYTTEFIGRAVASDLREVLYLWQQPEIMETSKAVFDAEVSWAGSPAMIDYINFDGNIDVDIEHGRFFQGVEGGGNALLRLVSLFNFDSWARRLRLGIKDIYASGLTFDNIDGQMLFENKQLLMPEPITVKAPSSTLNLAGLIDLNAEELDTKLVATLPVGGNLTFLAALAAGLPAAAGVWAVSKIFKKQMNKAASVSYRITGPWEKPNVEFERLFDSDAARGLVTKKAEEDSEPTSDLDQETEPALPP